MVFDNQQFFITYLKGFLGGVKFYKRVIKVSNLARVVTKALIGGWIFILYIRVLSDEFLLKSVVITVNFKRNSSGRHEYMNIHPHLTL